MDFAPPNFDLDGRRIVFADISWAEYELHFDVRPGLSAELRATSLIKFTISDPGFPAFDFTVGGARITSVALDGVDAAFELASFPGIDEQFSYVRAGKALKPGEHRLECVHVLEHFHFHSDVFRQVNGGIRFRLRMRDVQDAAYFSGRYWPSGFEHDQYPSRLRINITGSDVAHRVMANGTVTPGDTNEFDIQYPAYFTTSFPFLDIVPEDSYTFESVEYDSNDGRQVPVTAYTPILPGGEPAAPLNEFLAEAAASLDLLETDFGPFPYDRVLIHARPEPPNARRKGGMEYAGATDTVKEFLYHELNHSYFARCVAPSGGNSGWIDEAIAVWCDALRQHRRIDTAAPRYATNMARRSRYTRGTHIGASKDKSIQFLAHLDDKLGGRSGSALKPLLRGYFEERRFKSTSTEIFKDSLERSTGANLDADFDKYVYGKTSPV